MKNSIPYGRQNIQQDDINAVIEALQSDFLTQGPKVKEFEEAFAKYVGAKIGIIEIQYNMRSHIVTFSV